MEITIRKKHKGLVLGLLVLSFLLITEVFCGRESGVYAASEYTTINNERYYYLTEDNVSGLTCYDGLKLVLTDDLYLTSPIFVNPDSGTVTINLNGYSIYCDDLEEWYSAIRVTKNATLILEDGENSNGCICNAASRAIDVCSANLVLRNVDLFDNDIGIEVAEGTVFIEETSRIEGNRIGIYSVNSSVTISDNAQISYNWNYGIRTQLYIYTGYDEEYETVLYSNLTVTDKAVFTGNNVGVLADGGTVSIGGSSKFTRSNVGVEVYDSTELKLSGNVVTEDNSDAGIMVTDNMTVCVDSGDYMHVEFAILNDSNNTGEIYFITNGDGNSGVNSKLDAAPGYIPSYPKDESVASGYVRISSGSCQNHQSEFDVYDSVIYEKCSTCFSEFAFRLNIASYDVEEQHAYYEGCDISERIYMTFEIGEDDGKSPYPTLVYGYFNTETGEESYSTTVPTQTGIYSVKISMLSVNGDASTEIAATPEHVFAIISKEDNCSHDSVSYYEEYFSGRSVITARCDDCGKIVMKVDVNTNNTDISNRYENDGRKILYLCMGDEIIAKCDGDEDYLDDLSFVYGYYKKDGSLKYSLVEPTEPGKYTVSIAMLEDDNNPNSAVISTDEVLYEIQYHRWKYISDITYLHAYCECCWESANVYLDSSGADYASRHYDDTSKEEYFDYDIFYQDNWTNQLGIEQFYILYDGVAVEDEFNSTIKSNYFYKPTVSGNYTARIVLLTDVYNPNSAFQSTDAMQYHLAGVSIGNPYLTFADYSEDQYAALDEPFLMDGVYQVDSFEDLMWVARYCSDKDINITADIVMNPITITDKGETVRCGSNIIYKWPGLGNAYTGCYTGNIYGNGHTIYGLYCKNDTYAGLIYNGRNNKVQDLTISDSVLYANFYSGGIIGYEESYTDGSFVGETTISNCRILNCSIKQASEEYAYSYKSAGGLIGLYYEDGKSKLTINNCLVDSNISGYRAGGLVGVINLWGFYGSNASAYISESVNLGNITGEYEAGGLIGYGTEHHLLKINKCANAGNIEAYYAGGLFGSLVYTDNSSLMTDCINIGKSKAGKGTAGGLFGRTRGTVFGTSGNGNYYYGAENAVGFIDDTDTASDLGTCSKLTKNKATPEYICSIVGCAENSKWTVTEQADCENSGQLAKLCLICGKSIETKDIASHGHNYGLESKCVYCLEEESSKNTASVFSYGSGFYVICILVMIVAVASIIAYKKNKRS